MVRTLNVRVTRTGSKMALQAGIRASGRLLALARVLALVATLGQSAFAAPPAGLESVDVEPVWAGHPVRFALETSGDRQYVAYYDAQRRLTVAMRSLDSREWQFKKLPSVLGWDSHNYVTLAVDERNHLHVSGNMHNARLVYFRSVAPFDISEFESRPMIGKLEKRVTYPAFLTGANGRLFFHYRHGASGKGVQVFNRYDASADSWSRVAERKFLDGRGKVSAYPVGPVRGPDGWFHLVWMWRDTSLGSTNHDLSYARSRDLIEWESASGGSVALPITPATPGVVVDPVASGGGLAGIAYGVGWDSSDGPVITYCKYGAGGASQVFNARWEGEAWVLHQATDWTYRWDLARKGTLPEDISVRPMGVRPDGRLGQEHRHIHEGQGSWLVDEATLRPLGELGEPAAIRALREPESSFPGMEVRDLVYDRGGAYFLRWETLGFNRDEPRESPWPDPGMLRVYKSPEPTP